MKRTISRLFAGRPAARMAVLVAAVVAAAVTTSTALAAGDGPGTVAVKSANDTIRKLLREKAAPGSAAENKLAAKVTTSVRGLLDVDELGQRALRDHWKTLTDKQKTEFMALLRELIEANYIKGLRANVQYEVVYTGERAKGADRVVTTEIKTKRNGRPVTIGIDYVLRKDGSAWRAYDVITDGVGLVENYRAQFNKIIAKEGFDGLLGRMKKKAGK